MKRLSMRAAMWATFSLVVGVGLLAGCKRDGGSADGGAGEKKPVIGVAFETLQTEAWVFSYDAIKKHLQERGATVLEAVADNDANRQFEQVNNFIARGVDGIILVPKDGQSALRMIKSANEAKIPIVLFNRPPADPNAGCVTVVADNRDLTRRTVEAMCEIAKKRGRKHKAMILIGDLGDQNAIGRRDGFEDAVAKYPDVVEVVARIPTEWNQEKALAGVTSAFQANPDIDFIFTSSDFMFPSIVSVLKQRGKYHKVGDEKHVILGGFDGDETAYRMLAEGYLDADGVQLFDWEAEAAVKAIMDLREKKEVGKVIQDSGWVATQENLKEAPEKMWGAAIAGKK